MIRVADIDELAATALAFSQPRRPGHGALSSLLDSGGLREQMIDLSAKMDIEFTNLTKASKKGLCEVLEHGYIAENPVDAMGALNADIAENYRKCLKILADDPGTAIVSLEFEFRDDFCQYPVLMDVAKEALGYSEKPLIVVNSSVNANNSMKAAELGRTGIPVINGARLALSAMENMFAYRDYNQFDRPDANELDSSRIKFWRKRLSEVGALNEAQSLDFLTNFDFPTVAFIQCDCFDGAITAANKIGFPVVMKSAQADLHHKSDADGVRLSLADSDSVALAYNDLSSRLGPRVLVAVMVEKGVELAFGMINDEQFGPIVMVSAGGVYIELLEDRKFIPAPCSVTEALHNLKSLKIYKILAGARGNAPC